mmetsp:Transcript_6229/g.9371  ORF Transcript_6229/g.9371 Transcript_6229/m.9371 type:complete len:268 (-) Transcript_6229:185-988(-)
MKSPAPVLLATMAMSNAMHSSVAFISPTQSMAKIASPIAPSLRHPMNNSSTSKAGRCRYHILPSPTTDVTKTATPTSLFMSYQLPPSGPPEPKGPMEQIESIISTIVPIALVGLFFASPLGGIFFAVTNSLFVLALLTPLVLFAGFKIWTALYTVEAPCPSCGVLPVRVLKNGEPGVCLNCGAFSRVDEKGDGLELCNNPYDSVLNENGGGSMFDALFGGGGGDGMSGGFEDVFGGGDVVGGGAKKESPEAKAKRQGTIIDVDVERD